MERPVEEVFGFVSAFENVPKWNYCVLAVSKRSNSPIAIGTTFHQVRKADEQGFQIVTCRPNRQVTVQTISPSRPEFEMGLALSLTAWDADHRRVEAGYWATRLAGTGGLPTGVWEGVGR